jgi:hypothetical protein
LAPAAIRQQEPYRFEHVGLNIFVPVLLTAANGHQTKIDFIVDTGAQRTMIDYSVSRELNAKIVGKTNNITPNGKSTRDIVLLPLIHTLSHSARNLEVVVDDMSLYSTAYKRTVGGLLGADFLSKYILMIDFAREQIGLLSSSPKGNWATVGLSIQHGLALVPFTLPSGVSGKFIFDTGADGYVDAMLFRSEVGNIRFVGPTSNKSQTDSNGSHVVIEGPIAWLALGNQRLVRPLVELSQQDAPQAKNAPYRSMIGLFAFRDRRIILDWQARKLMIAPPFS